MVASAIKLRVHLINKDSRADKIARISGFQKTNYNLIKPEANHDLKSGWIKKYTASDPDFLNMGSGVKLRSSCLYSKHFTDVFPQPHVNFFLLHLDCSQK